MKSLTTRRFDPPPAFDPPPPIAQIRCALPSCCPHTVCPPEPHRRRWRREPDAHGLLRPDGGSIAILRCVALALSHAHCLSPSHTHSLALPPPSLAHTHSLSPSLPFSLFHTLTLSILHSGDDGDASRARKACSDMMGANQKSILRYLCVSLSHTGSLSLPLSRSHTLALSLSRSLTHSLSRNKAWWQRW